MDKEVATNTGRRTFTHGLRIRVKTIGRFLHFIRRVAHRVFHCAVHFCEYCTH